MNESLMETMVKNDCDLDQAIAIQQRASAEAIPEPQAQSARSSVASGSLPASEAEALSQEWLGRSLKCAAASRKDSAEGRDTHAWCNEVRSATYLLCADELRQRAGLPTSRQPEENTEVCQPHREPTQPKE